VVEYLVAEVGSEDRHDQQRTRLLPGVDEPKHRKMAEAGYGDDVAIANADLDELAEVMGSKFLAARTREKARKIVPEESWSLDYLGLPEDQTTGLRPSASIRWACSWRTRRPRVAKRHSDRYSARRSNAAARDKALGVVANEAATALATGSIATAPVMSLANGRASTRRPPSSSSTRLRVGRGRRAADPAAVATTIGVSAGGGDEVGEGRGDEARSKLTVRLLGADATVAGSSIELPPRSPPNLAAMRPARRPS
jgi:hypothetical protein